MPKKLHRKLQRTAKNGKSRSNRYIYGTMRKLGWKPKKKQGK